MESKELENGEAGSVSKARSDNTDNGAKTAYGNSKEQRNEMNWENAKRSLFKTGNDLGAYFEQNRRSDGVQLLADKCIGTNLGQIEIRVRRVALGCVARMSSVVREFGCFVTNPALAGA